MSEPFFDNDPKGEPGRNRSVSPELWRRFAESSSEEDYFSSWLAIQSSLIPDIIQSLLVTGEPDSDSYAPVARWPESGSDSGRLAEIAERVIVERRGLLGELSQPAGYAVAYPLVIDGRLYGVVAVEMPGGPGEGIRDAMENLQWGTGLLELYFRRRRVSEAEAEISGLKSAVDLLAGVLGEEDFDGACMALVTALALRYRCDRVSLGIARRGHVHVQAMSHTAHFDRRMKLVRSIGAAMDEAVLQGSDISFPRPPGEGGLVVAEHERLSELSGGEAVLTLPLYSGGRYYAALTAERPSGSPFSEYELIDCRSIFALVAPALEAKRLNDRPLVYKSWDAFTRQAGRLFGPGYIGRKLGFAAVAALAVFFSLATGEYRITSDATLEPTVMRSLTSPFNGYVGDAFARAGDVVKEGGTLCVLDDKDMYLERFKWLSQLSQYRREQQDALAKHDRSRVSIIAAQLDQAEAQLNLVENRLKRTSLTAPFDGLVVSGDLSQRLGGLVEQGEVLFEVAPLDAYRVILKVDETRIADVREGQRGRLVLASLPEEYFGFAVKKITPISSAEEGVNYFRVEAELDGVSKNLRPGMEGVGKVFVDRRKLIVIWTRSLREWLQLWLWKWWP